MRYIPAIILMVAFPAWFYFALVNFDVLVYIYAIFGYAFVMWFAFCWAGRIFDWQRHS